MSDDQSTPSADHSGDDARAATIATRMARQKVELVEQLQKIPIVQVSCEKVNVSRATFYNWKRDDAVFAKSVDEAIGDGTGFVNDMAESQLLSAIRDGNLGAITYWLKHRHAAYSNRLEVTTKQKQDTDALTPAQEKAIRDALQLAAFTDPTTSSTSSTPSTNELSPTSSGTESDRSDAQGSQNAL